MKLFHINHRDLLSVQIYRNIQPDKIVQLISRIKELSFPYCLDKISAELSKWNLNRIRNKDLIYDGIKDKLNEKTI
jgi:hypothetical protein